MSIDSMLEFIRNETPENEELLILALQAVHHLLSKEQDCIDHRIPELLLERNYDRVNEYVMMSKTISDIFSYVKGIIKKYDLDDGQAITQCTEKDLDIIDDLLEDDMEILLTGEKRINYENFRVDETIAYNLMTDFRYMRPAAFSLDGIRYPARLWKLVLLKTCELLWEKNHSIFENFVDDKFMQGKIRNYFSKEKETMGKPELVNGTDIFVETNLSANSIRDLIVKMLDKYRIPHVAYQIYLSKDLNPLHIEDTFNDINVKDKAVTRVLDMQEICDDYDCKTEKCMNERSPYFIMECCKKENCSYIEKKHDQAIHGEKEDGELYVLPKKVLKKKVCPQCGNVMERTMFPIEFEDEGEMKCNNIYGCWCPNCSRSYITEGTYCSFVQNKKEKKIKISFVKEENRQLSLF